MTWLTERGRDPYEVARRIQVENLDTIARKSLIEECFSSSLIKAIYRTRRDYATAVEQALEDLLYPDEITARLRPGTPIFEPRTVSNCARLLASAPLTTLMT